MERYIDNTGENLYKKFSFLDNFKNFKTLLFVDLSNTNNNYYAFIQNNELIYLMNIDSKYSLQEFILIKNFKKFLINLDNLENKNIEKILKNLNKLEIDLLNVINDWINNMPLNSFKKYIKHI